MTTLGTGFVYVNGKREQFTLYKADSAGKHATSDEITLKQEFIKALNLPESSKEPQGDGVYRVRINGGKGYLVYRTPLNDVPNSAVMFHFHWNYHLDLPLSAT
jgi:putative component of toxin-antitoxin plasmid stabilization module